MTKELLSGNDAVAEGVRLARAEVVAAYPITPQTTIVERLAEMVARHELAAEYIPVESEHSAMAASIGASLTGARAFTATSSQGLALMHEMLHWASGQRVPVVMANVNRALAPPWNIWVDHSDSMAQRDTGWIQIYAESNQEVLDTVLEAYRLAEHRDVRLPVMVTEDAFYLSHTVEPVDVPDPATVDAFLPRREPHAVLAPGRATRLGSFTGPDHYVDFRQDVGAAMERVREVLPRVEQEYLALVGRDLGGPLPTYRTEGADVILVTMGTLTTTARGVVDDLRAEGRKVGLAKLRVFRPFPDDELRGLVRDVARIGVVDRSFTFGRMGPAATEVSAALYTAANRPELTSFLAGIGGRDVTPHEVRRMFETLLSGEAPATHWEDIEEEVKADG